MRMGDRRFRPCQKEPQLQALQTSVYADTLAQDCEAEKESPGFRGRFRESLRLSRRGGYPLFSVPAVAAAATTSSRLARLMRAALPFKSRR